MLEFLKPLVAPKVRFPVNGGKMEGDKRCYYLNMIKVTSFVFIKNEICHITK